MFSLAIASCFAGVGCDEGGGCNEVVMEVAMEVAGDEDKTLFISRFMIVSHEAKKKQQ